jgi:fido (protein-threonine AMPylation protein)
MPVLFDHLREESDAAVRAVLGHFFFVFVHPYPDGNGRMARFLMNTMLASGGYPWTIIAVEQRARYFAALEAASVQADIEPFARVVRERLDAPVQVSAISDAPPCVRAETMRSEGTAPRVPLPHSHKSSL